MNTWFILVPLLALVAAKPPMLNKAIPTPPQLTCDNVDCGYHATCKMVDNMPICLCDMSCDSEEEEPFCDVDGNEYKSLCEVQKKICETKNIFFYLPGKCQGCKDSEGMDMEHNEIRPPMEDQPCLEERCNHGSIIKQMNKECLNKLGHTCTIGEGINDIECGEGFSCHVTKRSDDPEKYPHLGTCKEQRQDKCYYQGKEHDLNKKFISPDCRSRCECKGWNKLECVSLCPPIQVTCASDEIEEMKMERVGDSQCKCKRPVCTKKTELCAMKPESGPCFAYFRKWHYNPESKGCKEFVYGGCHGNGNRFETKEECEEACKPVPVPIAPIPEISDIKEFSPRESSSFRWPRPKPKKPILSEIDMTVKGKIRFNGVKKILQNPSCMFVVLSDVSLMDVPSTTIFSQRFDLSGYDTSNDFEYTMTGKKPGDRQLWRRYSISAYIYRNRCPDVLQSVNRGDFLTDTQHPVEMKSTQDEYEEDINIICYACEADKTEEKEEVEVEKIPARDSVITVEESDENKSKKILLKPGCQFEGRFYKIGQSFANKDCTGSCTCQESGEVACVSLCPPKEIACDSIEKVVTITVTSSLDPRCQCQELLCANKELSNDECVVQGEVYKINDTFVSKDCGGVCRCDGQLAFSCVSLCPPMVVMCASNEIKKPIKEETSRPGCFCDRETCVPASPVAMQTPPKILGDDMAGEGEGEGEGDMDEYLPENEFYGGIAYNVTLEKEKKVVVKGVLVLPEFVYRFPNKSCMLIKIDDVSIADASSFTIMEVTQDLSGVILNSTEMELLVKTPKPVEKDLDRRYSLDATLFRGRCGKKSNDVDDGDYYTDTMFAVSFSKDSDEFKMEDVKLQKYEKYIPIVPIDRTDEFWPEGGAPDVTLEKNKTIVLEGRITFEKELGKLPNGSCIKFQFEDASLMDVSSFLVKETQMDMSGVEIKDEYKFKFTAPKPIEEDLHDMYSISATLNVGWCPENSRFRENDWYTDTMFHVALVKENDTYSDIEMFLKEYIKFIPPVKIKNDDSGPKKCYDKASNKTYIEGEIWIKSVDHCKECECIDGEIECRSIECPLVACEDGVLIKKEGECCEKCVFRPPPPKDCYVESTNTTYKHGSNFKLDACTSCMCRDGETRCAVQDCVRPLCRNPIIKPGECCPVCKTEECFDAETERFYKNNEMWVQADGCTRCYCFQNQPMCATPMCFLEQCDEGVKHINVKGICCPICENKQVCRTPNGRTFVEGRIWHNDKCELCRCTTDGIKCEIPNMDVKSCKNGRVVQLSRECGKICLKKEKKENEEDEKEDNKEELPMEP